METEGAATGPEAGVAHTERGRRSDSPSLTARRRHRAPGCRARQGRLRQREGKAPLPWAPTPATPPQPPPAAPRRRGTHPLALHRARHLVIVQVPLEFGRHGRAVPWGSVPRGRSLEGRAGSARQTQDGTRRARAQRAGPGRAGPAGNGRCRRAPVTSTARRSARRAERRATDGGGAGGGDTNGEWAGPFWGGAGPAGSVQGSVQAPARSGRRGVRPRARPARRHPWHTASAGGPREAAGQCRCPPQAFRRFRLARPSPPEPLRL